MPQKQLLAQPNVRKTIYTAIPFLSGMMYLLAFFPGICTFDSVFQWDQAARFVFNNWHPAYHTILLWLLTRAWDSPAIMALFQVILFSLIAGYGIGTFDELGVSFFWLLGVDIFMSVLPLNGILVVTLWKDTLYSLCVLLLVIYLFRIILTKGDWLAHKWNWLYLGLAVANVSLLRYNGLPVAIGVLAVGLLWWRQRRAILSAFVFAGLFIGLILGPVYNLFHVNRVYSQPVTVLLIHPIAAYIHAGAVLTPDESAYLDQFHPLADGWNYSCFDATVFFYTGVRFEPLWADQLSAARLFGRLVINDPMTAIRHFYCLSTFVWKPVQPQGVTLETVYVDNINLNGHSKWGSYEDQINQASRLAWLKNEIVALINNEMGRDPGKIAWRPAIYLYVTIFSCAVYAWRRKSAAMLLVLIPLLIQTAVIAISAQLQAVRYQYPIYLTAMLFTLPLLYLAYSRSGLRSGCSL